MYLTSNKGNLFNNYKDPKDPNLDMLNIKICFIKIAYEANWS